LLKSLHFIMTSYDLKANPGLWRPGGIHVTDEATGDVVYEGADPTPLRPINWTQLRTQRVRNCEHAVCGR
jgi:hypothetical protein